MSDPIQSAFEIFEAARLKCVAMNDRAWAVAEEVEAALGPKPHRTWASDEPRHRIAAADWWQAQRRRRVAAQLGTDEDGFCKPSQDRMDRAYAALDDIQATTVEGLRCQIRARWNNYENMGDTEVPRPDKGDGGAEAALQRFYHDLERLAGEARS
jgi:hypothetical protein